jgi:hypothetical protein
LVGHDKGRLLTPPWQSLEVPASGEQLLTQSLKIHAGLLCFGEHPVRLPCEIGGGMMAASPVQTP